jgi:hypothetical protein
VPLIKNGRPMREDEFLKSIDIPTLNNAIETAEFPEHVRERIFEIEVTAFSIIPRQ